MNLSISSASGRKLSNGKVPLTGPRMHQVGSGTSHKAKAKGGKGVVKTKATGYKGKGKINSNSNSKNNSKSNSNRVSLITYAQAVSAIKQYQRRKIKQT